MVLVPPPVKPPAIRTLPFWSRVAVAPSRAAFILGPVATAFDDCGAALMIPDSIALTGGGIKFGVTGGLWLNSTLPAGPAIGPNAKPAVTRVNCCAPERASRKSLVPAIAGRLRPQ